MKSEAGNEVDNRQRIERYYALVDEGDLEQMLALFADDCVYERPGMEPLRGKDQLEAFYRDQRVIESGGHTLHMLMVDDNTVAVEGTFDGTLRDGRDVSVRFADVFELGDGLVTNRRSYFFVAAI